MIGGIPLVDAHMHVAALAGLKVPWEGWTAGFASGEATRALYDEKGLAVPERFHAYLDQEGVDIALVLAEYSPRVTGIQAVEDILPLVEHDPGRVRLVANLNPHLHHPITDELERQLALGAVALKIHPVHGGFPVNARGLYKAYALCEERGIPVVVHFGTSVFPGAANRYLDAAELNDVVDDFPDLTLVLAHGGRGWAYEIAGVLALARPNVWIEISGLPPKKLPEYFNRFDPTRLAERFIFGTDWPGVPGIRVNAEAVAGLGFDRELLEKVLYRNALAVYGLELPPHRLVIVDVHTHTPTHRDGVPAEELRSYDGWLPGRSIVTTRSWADYDEAFSGVDVSIVFNIAVADPLAATGLPTDPARINESTAEFVANDSTRRIGFLSVHPDDPRALEEVERCRQELGLVGIKLGPNYQDFDPLSPSALALYDLAERLGMPIMFHQGTSPIRDAPLRYAHPLLMDEIAIRHPELRVVMAHMGHPWQRETIVVIRKHPNVFADVSAGFFRPWSFYQAMLLATEWGVLGKLLLGSDYPVATPAETVEGLRRVNEIARRSGLPEVPDDAVEEIIHRDSLPLLGLAAAS